MNFPTIYRRHFAISNQLHSHQSSLCVLFMGHTPQLWPMTGLLNPAMKKVGQQRNAYIAVVLIMKVQYGFQIIPMVIGNRYFGVLKIESYANRFSGKNHGTTLPCWPKAGNWIKLGLTALSWDCGSLSTSFALWYYFLISSYSAKFVFHMHFITMLSI